MTGAFGKVRPAPRGLEACPCGGLPPGTSYDECCGRFHAGAPAGGVEELMRSRYAAFALGDADYLLRTWHPRTRPESLSLDPGHRWVGLQVLEVDGPGPGEDGGTVRYRARSRAASGVEHVLEERSWFERRGGRWLYVDGDIAD